MKSFSVCLLLLVCLHTVVAASYSYHSNHNAWVDPLVKYHARRGTKFETDEATQTTLCYTNAQNVSFNCSVNWYNQTVDHFSFDKVAMYNQKYLVYDKYYNASTSENIIFFYSGNEGAIELFAQNSGLLWDLAPDFNALLVFAEHRYYGSSFPFGSAEAAFESLDHLQYLSVEQALADYAILLTDLKKQYNADTVITFGGSYGGMLSAWFRMKYPHVVDGAIACSAPIYQFENLTSPRVFSHIVTEDFYNANPDCATVIYHSWDILSNLSNTTDGLKIINDLFPNCGSPLNKSDVAYYLFPFLAETYVYLAMADYPYPANFLGNLPGNPVNYVCSNVNTTGNDTELLEYVANIARVFWGYQQNLTCFDIAATEPASLGAPTAWNYQSCTEMFLPVGQYYSGPSVDFFYASPWDVNALIDTCALPFNANTSINFGVVGNPEWIVQLFGGKNIGAASRIVFSNGNLDPWSGGGVLESVSNSLVALNVSGGAHHLDLRGANPADPEQLQWVREQEKAFIQAWVKGYDDPKDMNATSGLDTKWVILISVGSTLATVIIALALFKWCRTSKKPETTSTYEAM